MKFYLIIIQCLAIQMPCTWYHLNNEQVNFTIHVFPLFKSPLYIIRSHCPSPDPHCMYQHTTLLCTTSNLLSTDPKSLFVFTLQFFLRLFYVVPSNIFNHLLWSVFQSLYNSLHVKLYVGPLCATSMYCFVHLSFF